MRRLPKDAIERRQDLIRVSQQSQGAEDVNEDEETEVVGTGIVDALLQLQRL